MIEIPDTESRRALHGRCIAVPESRELDIFATLLERRGAQVLRCPLIDIRNAPDPEPVLAWLRMFCAGGCDDLILFTGEGLRRLEEALEQHAPQVRAGFITQLGRVRKIARGPKPGRVLREWGLKADVVVQPATTTGIIAYLQELDLDGRRIGVQLYGSEPNAPLMDFLGQAGAQSLPVAPYVYADAAADADVVALIAKMHQGAIDAVAFTSMQQVKRLFRVAELHQQTDVLREALARTMVAAIGPIVADELVAMGIEPQVIPAESHYLKPFTQALMQHFGDQPAAGQSE